MDMFSLKKADTSWIASCRACGDEQTLPESLTEDSLATGMAIKCPRCPSEEPMLSLTEASCIPAPGGFVGQTV